jgi:PTS system mannose-specific IIC component
MGTISLGVIIILTVYAAVGIFDSLSVQIGPATPLFAGAFVGLVMGDLKTGLEVGATLTLMTLGVATYGGAAVPDYLSGAIIGTAYAIISGEGMAYGIGVAIPIGLLLTQADVLGRMANTFWQHRAVKHAEKGDDKGVDFDNVMGWLSWFLSRMIPVSIGLIFGDTVVEFINKIIPQWFMTGLKTAGAILPAMGIAILLHYLPIKKYWSYFLIGFVLMAYFTIPAATQANPTPSAPGFTVLGVALVGLALAGIFVSNYQSRANAAASSPDSQLKVKEPSDVVNSSRSATNLYADEEVNFDD